MMYSPFIHLSSGQVELGLDVVHPVDGKEAGGFRELEDFLVFGRGPAEKDQVVGQGFGQEALVLILARRRRRRAAC